MRWTQFVFRSVAILAVASSVSFGQQTDSPQASQPATVASTASALPAAASFEIRGTDPWLDTKLELRTGDQLTIKATGTLSSGKNTAITPAGAKRGFADMLKNFPVNSAGTGALIGRVGDGDTAQPFLIGPELKWTAAKAGVLFLGINRAGRDAPTGSFKITVEWIARGPEPIDVSKLVLPEVTLAMIDSVPRRVQDAQGTPGDNTNFVIVGPEQAVVGALKAAGWVTVDKSNNDAVLAGIGAVLNKDAYLTIPMSQLMLFGRAQDYGWAHADPLMVVAQRHHFRLWKAPFTAGGREVWIGAGTHDIGFDRDQRNNGITHKIDPDVDLEREWIGASLKESGQVAKTEYIMPSEPNTTAKTAHGEEYHSDGRLLIIHLLPQAGETIIPDVPASVVADNPGRTTPAAAGQVSTGQSGRSSVAKPAGTGNIFEGVFSRGTANQAEQQPTAPANPPQQ